MAQITGVDILQHNINRFGMVTVLDVYLFDTISNKPVMALDTLKISNMSGEGQQKEIKGGRYADLLATYSYGRTVSLEFQDALLSMASMEALWGAVVNQDNITYHGRVQAPYGTGVTLPDYTGATNTGIIAAYNVTTGVEITKTNVTVTAKLATITSTIPAATDEILIFYTALSAYAVATHEYTPMEAIIRSSSFPKTVKFVGKSFLIEQATGKMVEVEIEIPRLKLASDFALTMEAEGDASVFDFSGMALVYGSNKDLFKIKTLNYLD